MSRRRDIRVDPVPIVIVFDPLARLSAISPDGEDKGVDGVCAAAMQQDS
jgi:hypothetical protein